MEMCYDEILVMPRNYSVMDQEEMKRLNAGWCIERKWWGYNIYLTHKERQRLTSAQIIAGLITGLASLGVATAVVGAVATLVDNYDDGYGVRIRMTGSGRKSILTGIFALSKSQQRGIASKNAILL